MVAAHISSEVEKLIHGHLQKKAFVEARGAGAALVARKQ